MVDIKLPENITSYLITFLFIWLSLILYNMHFPNIKIMKKNMKRKVASEDDEFGGGGFDPGMFTTKFEREEAEAAEKAAEDAMSKTYKLSESMKKAEDEMMSGEMGYEIFQELAKNAKLHALKTWCESKGYVWEESQDLIDSGAVVKMCKHTESTCNAARTGDMNLIWKDGVCYNHPSIYKDVCNQISDSDSKQRGSIRGMTPGGFYEYTEGIGSPSMPEPGKTPPSCHPTYKYCKCEKMVEYDKGARNCMADDFQTAVEGGTNTLLVRESKRAVGSTVAMCAEAVGIDPDSTDALDSCNQYYTGLSSNMSGTQVEAAGRCLLGKYQMALTAYNLLGNIADEHLGKPAGLAFNNTAKNVTRGADYLATDVKNTFGF